MYFWVLYNGYAIVNVIREIDMDSLWLGPNKQ